jgi:hypothetical protein
MLFRWGREVLAQELHSSIGGFRREERLSQVFLKWLQYMHDQSQADGVMDLAQGMKYLGNTYASH